MMEILSLSRLGMDFLGRLPYMVVIAALASPVFTPA